MFAEHSQFTHYSIGIVAIDKPLNSEWIEVSPIEVLPMLDGEVTDHVVSVSASGQDASGRQYERSAKTTNTIKAKWIAFGQTNRMTPPDVRRGEKVRIYRLSDSDVFYWSEFEHASNTRRLETVVQAYSGTRQENEVMKPENSYTQGVSTHEKWVNLITTSKADGERWLYKVFVDAKNGQVWIKDDIGNEILLDSGEHRVKLKNASGSFIDVVKKQIDLFAEDAINLKTKAINAKSQSYDGDHGTIMTKGTRTQQGDTTILGNTGIFGGLAGHAGAGSDGSAVFNGTLRTKGDVIAGVGGRNVSLLNHRHRHQASAGNTDTPF